MTLLMRTNGKKKRDQIDKNGIGLTAIIADKFGLEVAIVSHFVALLLLVAYRAGLSTFCKEISLDEEAQ